MSMRLILGIVAITFSALTLASSNSPDHDLIRAIGLWSVDQEKLEAALKNGANPNVLLCPARDADGFLKYPASDPACRAWTIETPLWAVVTSYMPEPRKQDLIKLLVSKGAGFQVRNIRSADGKLREWKTTDGGGEEGTLSGALGAPIIRESDWDAKVETIRLLLRLGYVITENDIFRLQDWRGNPPLVAAPERGKRYVVDRLFDDWRKDPLLSKWIEKYEGETRQRWLNAYRQMFLEAKTLNDLDKFVAMFEDDDPEKLVVEARKLAASKIKDNEEAAVRDRLQVRIVGQKICSLEKGEIRGAFGSQQPVDVKLIGFTENVVNDRIQIRVASITYRQPSGSESFLQNYLRENIQLVPGSVLWEIPNRWTTCQ